MTIKTDLGYIDITNEVLGRHCRLRSILLLRCQRHDHPLHVGRTGHTWLGLENQSRGVKVTEAVDGGVNIDLHIAVEHGVNIATVCRSIIGEVRYHVERLTGVDVKNVDIYVESIKAD